MRIKNVWLLKLCIKRLIRAFQLRRQIGINLNCVGIEVNYTNKMHLFTKHGISFTLCGFFVIIIAFISKQLKFKE